MEPENIVQVKPEDEQTCKENLIAIDVSIILPVYNAEKWLDECFQSILNQTSFEGKLEISIFNDSSTDSSATIIDKWVSNFCKKGVKTVVSSDGNSSPLGVGYAKNRAVEQSSGKFLCFQDSDDVMLSDRIKSQFIVAKHHYNTIIGSQFYRLPQNSTERFTNWANNLTEEQLYNQIYTSHGPTVIMPTWFCSRKTFENVGGFVETGKGTPEDLIFFLKHIKLGGAVHKINKCLLMYRYHVDAATFSVHEDTIWNIRVKALQENVIENWSEFTIWNAGRQGRKLYRSLRQDNQRKVIAFCDVDENKISKGFYIYEESSVIPKPKIPVVHFKNAKPPFIICVKQDLTGGVFEENLKSLNLREGVDFYHFN